MNGSGAALDSNWLVRYRPDPMADLRLFAFPHAGAGPAIFKPVADRLPPGIELIAVQLPGHGRRLSEAPFRSAAPLIATLAPLVASAIDRPYAMFGHSMGAFLVFELARALRRAGLPPPRHSLLSGRRPPNYPAPERNLHLLNDAAFVAELTRHYDGIPAAIRNEPELLSLFLPVLKADFAVFETYRFYAEPPLSGPLTLYGGSDDPQTAQMAGWADLFTGPARRRLFPGGHFYLMEDAPGIANALADDLAPFHAGA